MTDTYPQNSQDSIDFLSNRAVNAENEMLKAEIRRLKEIIETLEQAHAQNTST